MLLWRPEVIRRLSACLVLGLMFVSCGSEESSVESERFVRSMTLHHEQGVELIGIGQVRSDDVRLRKMIFEMGSYHHADLGVLAGLSDGFGPAGSSFPGDVGREVLDELSRLEGRDFDTAWLDAMIHHHEGALVIAGRLLGSRVTDSGLLEFGRHVVTVQTAEIADMKDLLLELG